jgi:hypothetical protein
LPQESKDDARAAKQMARAEKRATRQADAAQRKQDKADERAAELETYGNMVADEVFGLRRVRIYDKGFVRVGVLLLSSGPFERLLGIESNIEVSKKSGTGRAVAAVMTMGVNLYSPNRRGDAYLTITTDCDVYALHTEPPTDSDLKAAMKLEGAGKAVLHRLADVEDAQVLVDEPTALASVGQQLRELAELHADGLVSDTEFSEIRDRLLLQI